MGLFTKKSAFKRFIESITDVVYDNPEIGPKFMEELEESLVMCDVGVDTADTIMEQLNKIVNEKELRYADKIMAEIEKIVEDLVDKGERNSMSDNYPLIILMLGVNGGGKTTSIAKLANIYKKQGKKVLLAAADTFRAAAAQQLVTWGERVGVRTVSHAEGTDPTAVIYDAIQAAKAGNYDVLICDTAGRLQNKSNLMKELEKMSKVISKEYPEATRENILVLDANTGKNAISQAEEFSQIADITGIILTKMDGTARGGISITIADQFDMAIKFIGMGEGLDDLIPFNAHEFAEGIFHE